MIEKRADGGENLVSIFRPVPVEDALDTIDERLATMNRRGIARGVLSLTPVIGVESLDIEDALPPGGGQDRPEPRYFHRANDLPKTPRENTV